MRFSIMLILWFHFHLLFRHCSSSLHEFLQSEDRALSIEIDENVLNKFFTAFNKLHIKKIEPRHIAVVGGSTNNLQQCRQLFRSYPYTICTKPETCVYPRELYSGSFIIVFIDGAREKNFAKYMNVVTSCQLDCELLFVVEGNVSHTYLSSVSTFIRSRGNVYFGLVHLKGNAVTQYRNTLTKNCTKVLTSHLVWKVGIALDEMKYVPFEIRNLRGCPISLSTYHSAPKMVITTNKNGSSVNLGGREGTMISLIAEKLNFKILVKTVLNRRNYSRKSTVLDEVTSGLTEMGISRLRQTQKGLNQGITYSMPYDDECVLWAVATKMDNNDVMWGEFTLGVWILIGLAFVVSCVGAYAYHKVSSLKNGKQKKSGFLDILLDIVSMNLGNSVVYIPVTTGGKLMLMICLFYTTVTTTGYKTSLSTLISTAKTSPMVDTVEEIVERKFAVGGSQYDFEMLIDQANDSTIIAELIQRYKVISNRSLALDRLRVEKNFAYLAPWSTLSFERRNAMGTSDLPFFGFDECTLLYSPVMAFSKSSMLLKPINTIIQHLLASGILEYWDIESRGSDKIFARENAKLMMTKRSVHYINFFRVYCVCLALCLFAFIVELLVPFIESKKK